MSDWRTSHFNLMKSFVMYINKVSDKFILKGGTSLLMCYNLDRFSEDLDFDGFDISFLDYVKKFIKEYKQRVNPNASYRIGKNTDTVKRAFIHYGSSKPLKIEVSYRKKVISQTEYTIINGIRVYSVQSILLMKINDFNQRDKLRDLYDIVFLFHNYSFNPIILEQLRDAIAYKGVEQFDFLLHNQSDELINSDRLLEGFLSMYYALGLR